VTQIAALLLALFATTPAWAVASVGEPIVYISSEPMGTPRASSPFEVQAVDGQQLELYMDYENSPEVMESQNGDMCVDADGDETCGFDVLIEMATDTAVFAAFTPPASVPPSTQIVGRVAQETPTSPWTLRVNGIDITGMQIPAPIGTLHLDAAGANQIQIKVVGRHRVGAAGQLDAIQERVIATPEPTWLWQLGSGLVGLALLARRRRWRSPIP
jgi:hypothetical protein